MTSGAAAVVGAALAVALAMVTSPPPERRSGESVAAVAAEFVERWEGWRRATVAFREETIRHTGDRSLSSTVDVIQRFPDQVVRDGDELNARVGGRLVGCVARPGVAPTCRDNGGYRPEGEIDLELAAWRELLTGPDAHYRISRLDDECFRLRLVVRHPRPERGDRYEVCFDPVTGVAASEETTSATLVLEVRRTVTSTVVADDQLALPAVPNGGADSSSASANLVR